MSDDRLLSIKQVAEAIGLNERTLMRWRARGRFPMPDTPEGARPKWSTRTITRYFNVRLRRRAAGSAAGE